MAAPPSGPPGGPDAACPGARDVTQTTPVPEGESPLPGTKSKGILSPGSRQNRPGEARPRARPPGRLRPAPQRGATWAIYLSPHIEQDNLYKHYDFTATNEANAAPSLTFSVMRQFIKTYNGTSPFRGRRPDRQAYRATSSKTGSRNVLASLSGTAVGM
jgi:hypothetical protein